MSPPIGKRRRAVSTTSPYAPIDDLNPERLVQFLYTTVNGEVVLYKDAACTIPVESIGDPIGGVKDPFSLQIVATQSTDADRPTWGGENVGAQVSEGDFLAAVSHDTDPSALTWMVGFTLDSGTTHTGENRQIVSHRTTTRPYIQLGTREADRVRAQWGDDSNFGPNIEVSKPTTSRGIATFQWSDTGSAQNGDIFYKNETDDDSTSFTGGSFASPEMYFFSRYGNSNFFVGECSELVLFDRVLSANERATATSAIEAEYA